MPDVELSRLALAVVAATTMGVSKTALPAASILAVALMAAAFPDRVEASVGAMLPALLTGDVFAVWRCGRHAPWDRLWGLFPYVALGMVPGYLVLYWLGGNQLRPVLGALVLALLALELARQRWGWNALPQRWWFVAGAGTLAGFGTTVANAGGPVMNLYLLGRKLDPQQFVGACAWFFFLLNLTKVVPFWLQGMLTPETLRFGLVISPAALIGGMAGLWLLPRIPVRSFQLLVLALTAATAFWLLSGR